MKLPTDNSPQSDTHSFLQDSSLFTRKPSEQSGQEPSIVLTKIEQKIVSPVKLVLGQLDSRGSIQINITVPASALTEVKLLGEGAYGSVYEGLWNEQSVAIKRLKAQHLTTKAVEELRQEAQIMFQLGVESKYIVPLKKICLEAPHYSLVMELMPKGSLYQLLHNGQDLPWSIRFQIALDTAWGLKDLHAYSILHRDLKSLNILLDDRLRAKLADFGLAKVKQETSSQSTIAKGTVLWMAPELFKRKAEVTAAADIWSLGMVLWELVSREIPFKDAQNQLQAMGWIKDGEKEEIPGDCPPALKSIIESCWDLTPTQRPSAGQVAERLKPLVTPTEQKQPSTPTTPSPKEDLRELEMQKLKAEMEQKMEQLKLAHEQQLRAATEEKQRLETEKQHREKEIERLKQQHQAELKRSQEKTELKLPSQTIATPPKPTPAPAMSQVIPQTLMPGPKPAASPEQLRLQDQLIAACEQGDEKAVTAWLKQGAKPDVAGTPGRFSMGKQPLGAAVWGMCPGVVNALLKEAKGIAPMTWEACEQHNLKHYKEVFIIPKFDPQTFGEWNELLQKMDPNPFIRAYHLKKADEQWHDKDTSSWVNLKKYVECAEKRELSQSVGGRWRVDGEEVRLQSEQGYVNYRTQIKQGIATAKQPTVALNF